MSISDSRIPSLDGLRAISIIIVVISHISYSHLKVDKFYLTGNLGVRIFFAISGFLITSILLKEYRDSGRINLKKFYFRRTFRIFPAYFFFLGLMFFYLFFLNAPSLPTIFYSFTYLTDYFFTAVPVELKHTWSLAVEEKFYLIFPVILVLIGLAHYKRFLILILIVTPVFRILTQYSTADDKLLSIAWNFHTNMDVLATGCLLALCRAELHQKDYYLKILKSYFTPVILILIIIFLGVISETHFDAFYLFGITIINLSIVLCIDWLIVNRQSPAGRLLNLSPLKFIGVLSYSIYLWQELFTFYSESMPWTYFPYNIILLSVFSLFSYYFVEKRFLNLRQELEKRYFPKEESENLTPASLNYGNNH